MIDRAPRQRSNHTPTSDQLSYQWAADPRLYPVRFGLLGHGNGDRDAVVVDDALMRSRSRAFWEEQLTAEPAIGPLRHTGWPRPSIFSTPAPGRGSVGGDE